MVKPKIFLRADGNPQIGLGHVIRSCALASILRTNFDCYFFIQQPSGYLVEEILNAGCEPVFMNQYESYEKEAECWAETLTGQEIVVLDGYQFGKYYQEQLKQAGVSLVCIDDIHAYPFLADIIINHSGGMIPDLYDTPFYTQFFLGFKYALLREPFQVRGWERKLQAPTLLICLGGADPGNETVSISEIADRLNFSAIHILVGSGYQHLETLKGQIKKACTPCFLHQNLNATEVAQLMKDCDYAVLSPSSIVLEYLSFGGVVFLHRIADNQKYLEKFLIENGLAFNIKELGIVSRETAREMLTVQRSYFDHKSALRLNQVFKNLVIMMEMDVRRAIEADLEQTYFWANDPVARSMSYHGEPIPIEEHSDWFKARLESGNPHYYIFQHKGAVLGQVRFEQQVGGDFILSYFIDPAFRGQGLGSVLLSSGMRRLKNDLGSVEGRVIGYVKKENTASCSSFEKMGFQKTLSENHQNSYQYLLSF